MKNQVSTPVIVGVVIAVLAVIGAVYFFTSRPPSGSNIDLSKVPANAAPSWFKPPAGAHGGIQPGQPAAKPGSPPASN